MQIEIFIKIRTTKKVEKKTNFSNSTVLRRAILMIVCRNKVGNTLFETTQPSSSGPGKPHLNNTRLYLSSKFAEQRKLKRSIHTERKDIRISLCVLSIQRCSGEASLLITPYSDLTVVHASTRLSCQLYGPPTDPHPASSSLTLRSSPSSNFRIHHPRVPVFALCTVNWNNFTFPCYK